MENKAYLDQLTKWFDEQIELAPTKEEQLEQYNQDLARFKEDVTKRIDAFNWGFQTFDDPNLKQMLREVKIFCYKIAMSLVDKTIEPYWLTILGESEIGKTYLTSKIHLFIKENFSNLKYPILGGKDWQFQMFCSFWGVATEITDESFRNYDLFNFINSHPIVIIDELDTRMTQAEKDKIAKLLSWRSATGIKPCKWTIITSNLTQEKIGEVYDDRTQSRLRRGNNLVIEIPAGAVKKFKDR